ncbi:hypothetical protein RDWZM_003398 [Blomia tropicalis]|uniref:Mannose-P-dolichol utilization defect 1 protein homolog n=1 Tax=Blomia tropicalis TaxID=40697 RepID=A0A9Q0MES5_BLOTA|nr:Mannose-P-dolichol utilization defect 1 protein [Blomia tropicalis]KAJ6224853.1 hypothetical protein RDWZM_003398 [Blomia tropicalis]
MEHIENACSLLYPEKCCQDVLFRYTINSDCYKLILVKTLGYGIIFASTLVKLPQILVLLSAKSGAGVSLFSVFLELLALTLTSSYSLAKSFPLSAWGEALFLLIMTTLVAFLIVKFDQSSSRAYAFLITFGTIVYIFMSGFVPVHILWTLQVFNVPLIISSKMVQAWANFQNGHTGNLSAITVVLVFLGSITRIFTSISETGDKVIILSYALSSVANAILVLQIIAYRNKTKIFKEKVLSKKIK